MENIQELKEEWREFNDAKGYFISNLGRVKITRKSSRYPNGVILDTNFFRRDKDGYARLSYRDNNNVSKIQVIHRLVALNFLEPIEGKNIVNHKDNNRLNNRVDNLEWVTPKENVYHSFQHGNRKKCLEVPRQSKLTPYQISQIPFLRQHYSLKKISDLFNISYTSMKNLTIKLKRLSQDNQQPSIYGNDYIIDEGSTTIPQGSTSQANGDGNALPTEKQ